MTVASSRSGCELIIGASFANLERSDKLSPADRAYVCEHRLWLCQYGPTAKLPMGFATYWLWQYTGDGIGPQPHSIPGIAGAGIDLNVYQGSKEQLRSEWSPSGVPGLLTQMVASSRIDDDEDQVSSHARQADADEDDAPQPQLNVQPKRAAYSIETEILQTKLDGRGYHDIGDIDGKWGGKTRGAITAFMGDRGKPSDGLTTETGWASAAAGSVVMAEISAAITEGWTRPIAIKRANATAQDIAPKVEAVRQSIWQRFVAKITGASAGGVAVVTGVGSQFGAVNEHLSPIKEFFANVPGWAWFAVIAAGALALWLSSNKATVATTQAYNTGKIN